MTKIWMTNSRGIAGRWQKEEKSQGRGTRGRLRLWSTSLEHGARISYYIDPTC